MPRELSLYLLVVILAGALSLFLCLFAQLKVKDAPGAKPYIIVTLLSSIFTFSYAFDFPVHLWNKRSDFSFPFAFNSIVP